VPEFLGAAQVVDDLAGDDGPRIAASGIGDLIVPQGMHVGESGVRVL
jgi:hypothetical protein